MGTTTSHLNYMADGSGNGGIYRESSGVWPIYYNVTNNSVGIGGSTTLSGYAEYVNGIGIASSSYRAPLFYDSDNTGYYTDPASTSNINNLTINGTVSGVPRRAATYCRWNTSTATVSAGSFNVTSVSVPSTGQQTINFSSSLGTTNYSYSLSTVVSGSGFNSFVIGVENVADITATSIYCRTLLHYSFTWGNPTNNTFVAFL